MLNHKASQHLSRDLNPSSDPTHKSSLLSLWQFTSLLLHLRNYLSPSNTIYRHLLFTKIQLDSKEMTKIISCSPSSTAWTSAETLFRQLYRFWTVALLCCFSCHVFSILNLQAVSFSFFSRIVSISVISNSRLTMATFTHSFPNFSARVIN